MNKQEITIYYKLKNRKVEAWGDFIATATFKTVKDMKDFYCEERFKKYVFVRLLKADLED